MHEKENKFVFSKGLKKKECMCMYFGYLFQSFLFMIKICIT